MYRCICFDHSLIKDYMTTQYIEYGALERSQSLDLCFFSLCMLATNGKDLASTI